MGLRLHRVVVACGGSAAGLVWPLRRCVSSPSSGGSNSSSSSTSHSGASTGLFGEMRPADVVTRVGPSDRLPGLRGVFLTRPVKKFHPIEVLPAAACGDAASSAPSATTDVDTSSTTTTTAGAPLAPPLVLNLAFAPRHRVSLRRFLALRHMFSKAAYLTAATEHGWYLIAPSTAAPRCSDVAGLQAWCARHHHRYLARPPRKAPAHAETGGGDTAETVASAAAASSALTESSDIAQLEAALDSGEELTEAQLQRLAAEEAAAHEQQQQREVDEDEEEDADDDDDGNDMEAATVPARAGPDEGAPLTPRSVPPARDLQSSPPPRLKTMPPLITEEHLFEINDGVAWPLPPADDLASPEYWRDHRQRMTVYESNGDADAADQRDALLVALRADPAVSQRRLSEQELYAAAEALYEALKQKANVTLSVDAATGLLCLVPLRDLQAGEELLLHYGREWWTGRLLSSLLLAVSDEQVAHIRWIERLFGHATDRNELFPILVPAHAQQQRRRRAVRVAARRAARVRASSETPAAPPPSPIAEVPASSAARRGRLVLYNTVSRKRATDAAVLAFAVRRSCIDQAFLNRLVVGNAAAGVPPVFELSTPDAEVPMRVLRQVLLGALTGYEKPARASEVDTPGGPAAAAGALGPASPSPAEGGAASRVSEEPSNDDESVFSV